MSRSALEKQMRLQMQRAQQQQFEIRQQQFQRQQQLQQQQLQQQQTLAYAAAYQQQTGVPYDAYAMAAYQQQVLAAGYYDPYAMYAGVAAGTGTTAMDPAGTAHMGFDHNEAGVGIDDEEDEDFDSDPAKKKNTVPMHGNTSNYNINTLLFDNIMTSDYFRALFQLRTYHEVISEIERVVKHVEPWQTGTSRSPSSAFCLLVKFMTMKLTYKQLNGLLTYTDCIYVRAMGLLYLRYVCPPADLWKWVEAYVEDDQEITPCSDKNVKMTVGSFATKLLTDMQYFGTTLPRIPVPIERKLKVCLLLADEKKKRRAQNLRQLDRFVAGATVEAIYSDDANEPAWYVAKIDSIAEEDEAEGDREDNSKPRKIGPRSISGVKRHRFWVTFPEYGNSECVDLGDMRLTSLSIGGSNSSGKGNTAATVAGEAAAVEEDTEKSSESERSTAVVRDNTSTAVSRSNELEEEVKEGVGHSADATAPGTVRHDNNDSDDDRDRKRHQRERGENPGRSSRDRSRSRDRHHRRDRHESSRREHSRDRHYRDRDRSSHHRRSNSRSSSRSRSSHSERRHQHQHHHAIAAATTKRESTEDLLQKVLEAERNASTAVGKNYAQRPASYKGSLSMKLDTYNARKRSPPRGGRSRRSRTPSPPAAQSSVHHSHATNQPTQPSGDRMKMLKQIYGDASALNK